MRKNLSITLTLLALLGGTALLSACNTMAGAGEDISATGKVVTDTAKKTTP
jgi:predicted small secreted protein